MNERVLPTCWLPWAKTDRKTGQIHRLIYHLLDVGVTAELMWDTALPDALKTQIASWLNLSIEDAGRAVAFFASTHDLGKASPAFQDHPSLPSAIRERVHQELESAGLHLPARSLGETHARHEVISTWALEHEQLLTDVARLPSELAALVAQAVGGHHGAWPTSDLLGPVRLKPQDKGQVVWSQVRKGLIQEMVNVFNPPTLSIFELDAARQNAALTLLSGIVSVADWLGSDEHHFRMTDQFLPCAEYMCNASSHARDALQEAEWRLAPSAIVFHFAATFNFAPNAFQEKVSEALQIVSLPALAIVEAPMGIGKTEAALAAYANWARTKDFTGLYVAMPTTATSNQMHERVQRFLSRQHDTDIKPLLVHSQALLREIPHIGAPVEEKDKEGDRAAAQAWFLPRKKSLLAPFGVGTVDQALMSVLQTKHFFVRLLGLSHKVVIFDEVHAYDAYMSVLFERLLAWLHIVGASVIVLSATLSGETRTRLLSAWDARTALPAATYPRLTWVDAAGEASAIELPCPETKTLGYDWVEREPSTIVQRLRDELRDGGCAAVICNTVARAQRVYKAVCADPVLKELGHDNLILFHARFPLAWREGIETNVLDKFGPNPTDKKDPNPHRPSKAIVIATQVIEQSLDLDFDFMITDHAPVDLLLQRAGRLQRHRANEAKRRHPLRLLIAVPEVVDDLPRFERSDVHVYDEYVLLRSWLALHMRNEKRINLPGDLSDLIEQVYGDSAIFGISSEVERRLAKAKDKMGDEQRDDRFKARQRLVSMPDDEELLWGDNLGLEEDDPKVHQIFQALTRGDRPGINVVCLHRVGDKLYLEPDGAGNPYDPHVLPDRDMIRELARRSVTVHHPVVEAYLLDPADQGVTTILRQWKQIAALRYHRLVIFEGNQYKLEGSPYTLLLSRVCGLRISQGESDGFFQPD